MATTTNYTLRLKKKNFEGKLDVSMMKTATIHHVSPLSGHAYTNVEAQEMNIKESPQPLYRISRLYVPIISPSDISALRLQLETSL